MSRLNKAVFALLFAAWASSMAQVNEPAWMASGSRLRQGLILYLRLEEASGTRYDRSMSGNHMTSNNSVGQSSGKVGNCASFASSSTQWLSKNSPVGIPSGNSPWTLTFWVNMTNKPTSGQSRDMAGRWSYGSGITNRSFFVGYLGTSDKFYSVVSSNGNASTTLTSTNFGAASAGTWYFVCSRYDGSTLYLSVNAGAEDTLSYPNGIFNTGTNAFTIGCQLVNNAPSTPSSSLNMNGFMDEIAMWNRALSTNEIAKVYNNGTGNTFPLFRSSQSGPSISSPAPFEVVQRTGTNADLLVSGLVGSGTHTIEARFNGGSWVAIQSSASGTFSGTLTNQVQGQGNLEVRWSDNVSMTSTNQYVGIGDVFAIGGQSNAMGFGFNNQSYSGGGLKATAFRLSYVWSDLIDPVSSNAGQVDTIYDDANALGSVWPLIATHFFTNQTIPISFVPCASDGSDIAHWQPSGALTNRSVLLGATSWRSKYATRGVKAMLWWQGETDAKNNVSQSTYYTNLTNMTASFLAVTGAKVMSCKFQNCTNLSSGQQAPIIAAIGQAWSSDPNSQQGPDLTDIDSDDGFHLRSDSKLATAAERWWNAIKTAFY